MGVGLGYALLPGNATGAAAINWDKVRDIFTGLLMAPLIGFTLVYALLMGADVYLLAKYAKQLNPDAPVSNDSVNYWGKEQVHGA